VNQGLRSQEWELDALLEREWLTTNGVGGYACSTVPGLNTRKYHGLLVAAMAPPVRRMVLLARVEETLWRRGQRFALDCNEYPGAIYPQGQRHLREFVPGVSPKWVYEGDGWCLQKRLTLIHGSNTVVLTYKLLEGDEVELQLRPLMSLRPIHDLTYQFNGRLRVVDRDEHHHQVAPTSKTPEVFFAHDGAFEKCPDWYLNQIYRREQERGYAGLEDLWTPGAVRFHVTAGKQVRFVCSTDPIDLRKLKAGGSHGRVPVAGDAAVKALCTAAEKFVVRGGTDRMTTVIAGYPWLGVRTRDALIGFSGLFLVQGRLEEARNLLLSLAGRMKNGLMPSEFPERGGEAVYRSADIGLWFVNAVWEYLRYDAHADQAIVRRFVDAIVGVIDAYRTGTDLGIRVDENGLLCSSAEGEATSWMDAGGVDGMATQRSGNPVELSALWYNAIRVAAELSERVGDHDRSEDLTRLAESAAKAFNDRFWNVAEECCFDVVTESGAHASVRPNQILAASLPFAVLSVDRHEAVLNKVRSTLLTPVGIRTLAQSDEKYRPTYAGNVASRDAAHHNGSAFPWLLGPYVQLMLRVRGRNARTRAMAREALVECLNFAAGQGMGQIPELFDGDAPHRSGGAIASAASVGQVLRCYVEDVLGKEPVQPKRRPTHVARNLRVEVERVHVEDGGGPRNRDASLRSGQAT
jgi:predicted glycogen debranching enzyme